MNLRDITNRSLFIAHVKQANEYSGISLQSYLPIDKKRNLSKNENSQIEEGSSQVIPRIFTSDADNPTVDMASPGWGAGIGGAVGAGLGGIGGAALGLSGGPQDGGKVPVLALLGAALGGTVGGVVGYKGRVSNNNTIRDRMARLPEGATRRDLESDPLYQRRQDRAAAMASAMAQGGGMGMGLRLL